MRESRAMEQDIQTVVAKPSDPAPTAYRLVVVAGPDTGAICNVTASVLVGSSQACALRLSDPTVSRRHVEAWPGETGLRVRDAGSRNGTWAGGVRVMDAELGEGMELRVGDTRVRIERHVAASPSRKLVTAFGDFLGAAPILQPIYEQLERAAATDATILLEGESGTGKEVLAEAIHEKSGRASGPLVVVDCGSIPENLVESELFGHEKGAFTGAERRRAGAFEQAHRGTLFLDEIGELPLAMQTRLLRALEARRVRRVGGSDWLPIDVRVVAATNRALENEVEEGRFRLDLFHRLAVVLIRVPSLRERPSDVPLLARAFAERLGASATLSDEVLARLSSHAWPGNVRELRNAVERLAVVGDTALRATRTSASSGADPALSGLPFRQARDVALERFTERYVADMLTRHGGNVSAASRAAGIARRYFQMLKKT
ncbi:MAG: sigma 54-interacting transcriptional regulator [Sandaracinaceae bacterium]|nr:sigma 54-interacting transcriptional regulator [Sandaracinaceae bacterium]